MSKDWSSEYTTMLDDCEKRESQLTDWERTFVDSLRTQIANDKLLTIKQTETLDNIWERVTKRG